MAKILFCDVCGTDAVWPKAVDHLEFPLDEEWSEENVQSLQWICENGHEGEPMVDVLVAGISHARVAETITHSEFLAKG